MLSDSYKDPLIGMYYLATLPSRRWTAARLSAAGQAPIIALYYHRVANDELNAWTISNDRFKAQIEWLRRSYDLISLVECQQRMGSAGNSRPAVCITFDDGYADNCNFAVPWLLDQNVPFTYFVSTSHILEGRPFLHDLDRQRPLAPNTPEQIRQMADAGVELGAHTRTHADLGPLVDDQQLHDEIVGSKRDLEEITDRAVRYFAFPFGLHANLSQAAFRTAFQAGYWGVCSAYGGYNVAGDDPFHIHRIHGDPSWARFRNWLTCDPRKFRQIQRFNAGEYRLQF